MKKFMYFLSVLMLSAGFFTSTSCNKIDDATTVEFEATYDADLDVQVSERNMDGTFSAYATIDPKSNSDFNKYLSNIKDIQVLSVTGTVLYTNPNFTLLFGELIIYSNNYSALWSYTNFPVSTGTSLTLGNENGQWDNVSMIANEKSVYHISLVGNTDVDDLDCTIRVTIKYNVKASAL